MVVGGQRSFFSEVLDCLRCSRRFLGNIRLIIQVRGAKQTKGSRDQDNGSRFRDHLPGKARLGFHYVGYEIHHQVDEDHLDQGNLDFSEALPRIHSGALVRTLEGTLKAKPKVIA